MILAVIPLILLAWVGGAAVVWGVIGLVKGRGKKKKQDEEKKKQDEEQRDIINRLLVIDARQKQHEDDLKGIISNTKTGQTAEEEEFGIMSNPAVSEQIREIPEEDDSGNRFKLLDL